MEVFIIVLSIIWSILCIILFFKVWKMTNDVASIADGQSFNPHEVTKERLIRIIKRNYFLGKVDEAYENINSYTYYQISYVEDGKMIKVPFGKPLFRIDKGGKFINYSNPQKYIDEIIEMVTPLYQAIGREIPPQLKNITYEGIMGFAKEFSSDEKTEAPEEIKTIDKD